MALKQEKQINEGINIRKILFNNNNNNNKTIGIFLIKKLKYFDQQIIYIYMNF